MNTLKLNIKRIDTPTIYLDTCILIEFSRLQNEKCTSSYKRELETTFALLKDKMQKKEVLCPLGNQLVEMGVSNARRPAKDFLYHFTNAELIHPCLIRERELDLGYKAFLSKNEVFCLDAADYFRSDYFSGTPFIIHVAPVYNPEKLSELCNSKRQTVSILNNMKATGKREKNFNAQLTAELNAGAAVLLQTIDNLKKSENDFCCYLDMIGPINSRVGITPNTGSLEQISRMTQYYSFLRSEYHHEAPYVWIESVLWAHRMQDNKKICDGDNLDTIWAAAYLPFVDYLITDAAFCELLKSSGLADQYGTKVYSMRDLNEFNEEIDGLVLQEK